MDFEIVKLAYPNIIVYLLGANMLSELNCGTSELSLPFGSGGIFSPSMSDSDAESDASFCVKHHRHQTTRCVKVITNQERLDKVAEFSERLSATPPLAQVNFDILKSTNLCTKCWFSTFIDYYKNKLEAPTSFEVSSWKLINDSLLFRCVLWSHHWRCALKWIIEQIS